MKLDADDQGFLKGRPLGSEAGDRLLAAIKRDTGGILSLLRATRSVGSSGWSRSESAPRARAATPAGRSGPSFMPPRGERGRFISPTSIAAAAKTERTAAAADAAMVSIARTAETQRRDAKADSRAASQARGSNGRFLGDGDGGGGMRGAGGIAGGLASGAGAAVDGAAQLDPIIAAAGEAKAALNVARNVATPIGRAGSFLLGRGGADSPPGLLRRVWRELRFMRRDNAKSSKDSVAAIKDSRAGGGAEEGGFSFGGLLGGLARLPMLLKAGGAVLLGGLATWISTTVADFVGDAAKKAIDYLKQTPAAQVMADAWEATKKIPLLGSVAQGAENLAKQGVEKFKQWRANVPGGRDTSAIEGKLTAAAERAGADPNLVLAIARKESRLDPTARPIGKDGLPMSSAHGLGQFLDSTWVGSVQKWGEKYGVSGASKMDKKQALALRDNVDLQAAMLAELTAENAAAAKRASGASNASGAYAMHVLGPEVGARLLKSKAGTPLKDVLSEREIANNPSLFGNRATVGHAMAALSAAVPMPFVAPAHARAAPGPMPSLDVAAVGRGGAQTAPAPAVAPVSQDVRDRTIAHIVTGGIGGSIAHR